MTAHAATAASYRYLHLDVFTERPFEGNQLAVFPDATGIPERWMQPIAREMAFSETVFMLPPLTGSAHKKLRIFTPGRELPLAGHPTIGSAFVWAKELGASSGLRELVFELGVGPIRVTLDWAADRPNPDRPNDAALAFAWMHQPTPVFGAPLDAAASAALSRAMHLSAASMFIAPPQLVSSGVTFLFAALSGPAAVDSCVPDASRLMEFFAQAGIEPTGVFVFSRSTRPDATLYSRMFGAAFGIQEDPATGGASGPLGAYALTTGIVTAEEAPRLISLQGSVMGRPSYIHIAVTGTRERIEAVRIGGTSRFVAEGVLTLP